MHNSQNSQTHRFGLPTGKRSLSGWLVGLSVMTLAFLLVNAGKPHRAKLMRWDIIRVTFGVATPPCVVVDEGGTASAWANNGARIRLTGSGTFRVHPHNKPSHHFAGGGTWETFAPMAAGGGSTGNGTYAVTELVSFEEAPGSPGCGTDNIGDGSWSDNRGGLAVFRIRYSDGEEGILTVSGFLPGAGPPSAPDSVFEGITATKGFVGYWNREAPLPNVDANRTLFHVLR